MAPTKMTRVMFDDESINVRKEVDLVFSIANSLRGPYKSDKYKDVIIGSGVKSKSVKALMPSK